MVKEAPGPGGSCCWLLYRGVVLWDGPSGWFWGGWRGSAVPEEVTHGSCRHPASAGPAAPPAAPSGAASWNSAPTLQVTPSSPPWGIPGPRRALQGAGTAGTSQPRGRASLSQPPHPTRAGDNRSKGQKEPCPSLPIRLTDAVMSSEILQHLLGSMLSSSGFSQP